MAEIQPIVMPKFGLSMTEGSVVEWHKAEGETVAPGEELFDVETTKITNAYESPQGGTLRRQVAAEGETLPVGALVAVLADSSVPDSEIDAFIADFQANFVPAEAGGDGEEDALKAQTAETPQGAINYLEAGGGSGPPVVLVHGFGGDLNNWMFLQPLLAEHHRTIALDLPGHGASAKQTGSGDVASLAEAVAGLMDALSIESAHLVGHSLGGAVSLHLASTAPRRVETLTLIAPAGLGSEVDAGYIDGFLKASRRKEMKPVLQRLFADPSLVRREMVEEVLKFKRLDGVDEALSAIADACFPQGQQALNYREALAGLSCPVQVIWGEADIIVPVSHAEGLPEAVTVTRLPGTGHMAQMEKSGEVARLIEGLAGR